MKLIKFLYFLKVFTVKLVKTGFKILENYTGKCKQHLQYLNEIYVPTLCSITHVQNMIISFR